jgi:hypothetical protein
MYSFKYNQQDATLYNILYRCQCSTRFRRFFRPSSGAQTVHTASGIRQACLLLPLAWLSWQCQQCLRPRCHRYRLCINTTDTVITEGFIDVAHSLTYYYTIWAYFVIRCSIVTVASSDPTVQYYYISAHKLQIQHKCIQWPKYHHLCA